MPSCVRLRIVDTPASTTSHQNPCVDERPSHAVSGDDDGGKAGGSSGTVDLSSEAGGSSEKKRNRQRNLSAGFRASTSVMRCIFRNQCAYHQGHAAMGLGVFIKTCFESCSQCLATRPNAYPERVASVLLGPPAVHMQKF